MNEAPKGFIPLDGDVIVAVHGITSVRQFKERVLCPAYQARYYTAMKKWYAEHPDDFSNSGFRESPVYLADRVIVEVEAGTLKGLKRDCSLVQFMAKMAEAIEEST